MRYVIHCILIFLVACKTDDNTIKIKGSDTEVNLAVELAESFHKVNNSVFVSISGGGSGLGIASLLNGTGDIANSSRSINPSEIQLFRKQGADIQSFIFAQDAVAFVVAEDIPLDSISTRELANLFNGNYKNWSSLINKNMPVNIYGRQTNSGTHDFVKTRLGIEFTPYAKQMNGNAQILEAIKADHSGIGYVGAGYINHRGDDDIKVLSVYTDKNTAAVSPLDAAMIAEKKYFFQRPLFQYYKADTYQKVKPFLDFEKSEIGKKIIQQSGYYPAK